MELVTNVNQLALGSRIAILTNSAFVDACGQFGIITEVSTDKVHFVDDETTQTATVPLANVNLARSCDRPYNIKLVSEEETIRLRRDRDAFARNQAAKAEAMHRAQVSGIGPAPLSGAAILLGVY